jgi:hypothetical protein
MRQLDFDKLSAKQRRKLTSNGASLATSASYRRRVKAARFPSETRDPAQPVDIDALRLEMARRILMLFDDWQECPLRICRRNRGCMAPNAECPAAKPLPPDPDGQLLAEGQWFFHKIINDRLTEINAERAQAPQSPAPVPAQAPARRKPE